MRGVLLLQLLDNMPITNTVLVSVIRPQRCEPEHALETGNLVAQRSQVVLRRGRHWSLELVPVHRPVAVELLAEGIQLGGALVRQDAQLLDVCMFVREFCLRALERLLQLKMGNGGSALAKKNPTETHRLSVVLEQVKLFLEGLHVGASRRRAGLSLCELLPELRDLLLELRTFGVRPRRELRCRVARRSCCEALEVLRLGMSAISSTAPRKGHK